MKQSICRVDGSGKFWSGGTSRGQAKNAIRTSNSFSRAVGLSSLTF
jgi:hypothetical protein